MFRAAMRGWCRWSCLLGLTVITAPGGAQAKEPQPIRESIFVYPQRAMHVAWNADGTVTPLSDWVEMCPPQGQTGIAATSLNDFDALFLEGNSCLGENAELGCPEGCCNRWFFGPSYCNTFTVAEMDSETDGTADHVAFSWYWYCNGSGAEQCYVATITGESPDYGCAGYTLQDGIIYFFGDLDCNPGGYYTTDVCLCDSGLTQTTYRQGASAGILARDFVDGQFVYATCAQFMLYGNSGDGIFDLPGSHGPNQFDDDNPPDGQHSPQECYDYAYGRCPDPLRWTMGMGDCFPECASEGCNGGESLKAKTRQKNCGCLVKGVLTNGTPGRMYGIQLPGGACVQKPANDRGKVVAKECPSRSGAVRVPTCGLEQAVVCP